MTIEEIQKRLDDIKEMAGDDEAAHSAEDRLFLDFIVYVSTLEIPTLAAKARLVMESQKIDFCRWCV